MKEEKIITGDPSEKICWKCDSENIVKNGFRDLQVEKNIFKIQKYKCQDCGYIFQELSGQPGKKWQKEWAMLAYKEGLSFNKISKHLGLAVTTISRWITPIITDDIIAQHAIADSKLTSEKEEVLYYVYDEKK